MALHPVILAGGSGTRLWPLSKSHTPKQFLSLTGKNTLFQEALIRLNGLQDLAQPVIVCNQMHRNLVSNQLMALGGVPSLMILEPEGRNSAPALTLACLALTQNVDHADPDPLVIAMPSDHVVSDIKRFQDAVIDGINLAMKGYIVTFGAIPTSNQTGYGYLRKGPPVGDEAGTPNGSRKPNGSVPLQLLDFIEKPDVDTVNAFLKSKQYLWNSGIFMMRASTWLMALQRYRPDIMEACKASMDKARRHSGIVYPNAKAFTSCPIESIDYAVMEKVVSSESQGQLREPPRKHPKPIPEFAGCAVIPMDAGWSDIGSWSAVWSTSKKDSNGNVLQGNVHAQSIKNSLVIAQDRLLVAYGLQDMVVVETSEVVLVAHKDQAQEIKEIVNQLRAEGHLTD